MSIRTLVVSVVALAFGALSAGSMAKDSEEIGGQQLLAERCHACHELSTITVRHSTIDEWDTIVQRMVTYGAQITDSERQAIVEYLAEKHGPQAPDTKVSASVSP